MPVTPELDRTFVSMSQDEGRLLSNLLLRPSACDWTLDTLLPLPEISSKINNIHRLLGVLIHHNTLYSLTQIIAIIGLHVGA